MNRNKIFAIYSTDGQNRWHIENTLKMIENGRDTIEMSIYMYVFYMHIVYTCECIDMYIHMYPETCKKMFYLTHN